MDLFATMETLIGGVRGTSLHGGTIGVPLMWCLLTTLLLVFAAADVETSCTAGMEHGSTD